MRHRVVAERLEIDQEESKAAIELHLRELGQRELQAERTREARERRQEAQRLKDAREQAAQEAQLQLRLEELDQRQQDKRIQRQHEVDSRWLHSDRVRGQKE